MHMPSAVAHSMMLVPLRAPLSASQAVPCTNGWVGSLLLDLACSCSVHSSMQDAVIWEPRGGGPLVSPARTCT